MSCITSFIKYCSKFASQINKTQLEASELIASAAKAGKKTQISSLRPAKNVENIGEITKMGIEQALPKTKVPIVNGRPVIQRAKQVLPKRRKMRPPRPMHVNLYNNPL